MIPVVIVVVQFGGRPVLIARGVARRAKVEAALRQTGVRNRGRPHAGGRFVTVTAIGLTFSQPGAGQVALRLAAMLSRLFLCQRNDPAAEPIAAKVLGEEKSRDKEKAERGPPEQPANKEIVRQPMLEVIRRNPKEILLSAFVRVAEQAPFYIFTTYVFAYGTGV